MQEMNFEHSFSKLEEILKKMNSGELSLDRSIAYYEEADQLIQNCQNQLERAEKKIEILIKNRDQRLSLDEEGEPQTVPFDPNRPKVETPT
jgi:exodeoxyribonuclease VII small subunit